MILFVPVEVLEKKPSGIEVKRKEKDPLPSSRKLGRYSSFPLKCRRKNPLVLKSRSERKILFLLVENRKKISSSFLLKLWIQRKKPSGIVVRSQEERERSSSFKSSQRKYPLLKSNCEEFFRSKSKRTRKRLPTTEVLISSFCSF